MLTSGSDPGRTQTEKNLGSSFYTLVHYYLSHLTQATAYMCIYTYDREYVLKLLYKEFFQLVLS